ncbi:MAG: hypothetical protein CML23_06640 [Rhizobiaceae bacterium]|nr:hypothetical protein [Rhizobiaceae bacterium]|tara:strand:- start:484 stop:1221 length:738 start_codon:yes stop_codon:yes gene_type:complete
MRWPIWPTVVISAGTGVGVLFSPLVLAKGYSSFQEFVFDYQPLIGGLLALFAAAATVWQMNRAERAVQKRHDEERIEQQKPIKHKIERFCSLCHRKFVGVRHENYLDLQEIDLPVNSKDLEIRNSVGLWTSELEFHLVHLDEVFRHKDWAAAEPFFPVDLMAGADTFQRIVGDMLRWTRECRAILERSWKQHPSELTMGEIQQYKGYRHRLKQMNDQSLPSAEEAFLTSLEIWAKATDIDFKRHE